ncbi:MAG TPA: extracellular solute-binding protein, partial [Conexibacter sp.]|nr:extracellular solute-binding protein [Conexibacter sp.]
MSIRRGGMALCAAVAATALLAGCGSSSDDAGSSAGSTTASTAPITVYSGQHEQTMGKLVADFERRTGIQVKLRSNDEATLANQLLREGSASPADVFVAENPPALTVLEEHGLLAPVAASSLAKVPARFNAPKGDWEALSARSAVLAYDTDEVSASALPTTLLDLAKPEWKGKLALAPTETDFQPIVTAVADRYGKPAAEKWLRALRSNAKGHIYPDNESLVSDVNSGRVQLGVINHYYWYRLRDEIGAKKIH